MTCMGRRERSVLFIVANVALVTDVLKALLELSSVSPVAKETLATMRVCVFSK